MFLLTSSVAPDEATLDIQEVRTVKIRPLYGVSILAIVLGLCMLGWIVFQPKQIEPLVTYKTVVPESPAPEASLSAEERYEETLKTKVAQEIAYMLENRADDPDTQALKRAMQSPEYLEYKKRQDAIFPGFNLVLWWDFLESQGIESSARELQEKNFRESFPTGDYADYEPMMRKELAEQFLASDPPLDMTDRQAMREYTLVVLDQFRGDWRNKIWMRGYFNGYDGDVDWAESVRRNAANIVTELTPVDTVTISQPIVPDYTSDPSITGSVRTDTEALSQQREDGTSVEHSEPVQDTAKAIEVRRTVDMLSKMFDVSDSPDFETELREHFSPERFNRAIQALNQYKPEERLRRLKASDPEVATHVERLIQRSKGDD